MPPFFIPLKSCLFFIATMIIFSACDKKIDSESVDIGITKAGELVQTDKPENTENTSLQGSPQEIIENYEPRMVMLFQVEGNFTNSGNKEILAFYQAKIGQVIEGIKHYDITCLYCFVLNGLGDTIEHAYEVKWYGTAEFYMVEENLESFPELGREIFWMNKRFGFIGDFNGNGKEECYFYEASGMGFSPRFYEFDGSDFKEILDYSTPSFSLNIIAVDKERKTISFEGKGGLQDDYATFIWDDNNQMYIKIDEQ